MDLRSGVLWVGRVRDALYRALGLVSVGLQRVAKGEGGAV